MWTAAIFNLLYSAGNPGTRHAHLGLLGLFLVATAGHGQDEESYASPAGPSVIVDPPGGKLPYLPAARKKAEDNWAHRERDPVGHCHMHGVPRVMVPPFPFMIVQDGDYVVMLFETEHSLRIIPADGRPHLKNYRSWDGDSRGRWEGDTLVVDVTGLNGQTWLDQAGNFVDENEHVVERFTPAGPDTIIYEATVDDPTVYSRAWTLRVPLRRQRKGAALIEYDCIEGERDEVHYPGSKQPGSKRPGSKQPGSKQPGSK